MKPPAPKLTERHANLSPHACAERKLVRCSMKSIPTQINSLQRIAVNESRLGIPLIFGRDVIHGFRTIFPIPLGQAACWNPQLVEKAAAIAARETRSVGVHWTFAPMVDIARDARWGRIAESFGEDPYLCSQFSRAMVRGFQGNDLSSRERIAACAKHFAGYGAAEGGRDYNSAVISPSLMRNVYLPPFRAAVDEGVATLMTAFNDVNGVPGSANTHLLRDVLRKDWKFQGFVVSDWESIKEMTVHGYCRDEKEAALTAHVLASIWRWSAKRIMITWRNWSATERSRRRTSTTLLRRSSASRCDSDFSSGHTPIHPQQNS